MRSIWLWAALLAATPARADCDHFKWSVASEKGWFGDAAEPLDAGAVVEVGDHAYELSLKNEDAAAFEVAPKKLTPGAFGGLAHVALAKAGLYQITLSKEAWVDVIQNGARAKTRNVSRQRDCAAFVKSVRFQLEAGAATVQFSGVAASALAFSVAPAP